MAAGALLGLYRALNRVTSFPKREEDYMVVFSRSALTEVNLVQPPKTTASKKP